MTSALLVSLKVLAVDVPLLLVLGTAIGWVLAKREFPGRRLLSFLVLLPVALPPAVLGLYLLMLFGHLPLLQELGFVFSFPAAALAALVPSLPLMVQSARVGFAAVPGEVGGAARTLGDGEFAVFRKVTLRLSRRSLAAGVALASARALGDFGVTLMLAGNIPGRTQTLPLYIFSQVEALEFAAANLAALVLTVAAVAALALVRSLEGGGYGRQLA
ncbi:MAG: ABC transporter permease subunit [Synergistales bacterium]|nr:ABC transporter permease subunit [Synergistales bacterium]